MAFIDIELRIWGIDIEALLEVRLITGERLYLILIK